jgi:hypothetical protein
MSWAALLSAVAPWLVESLGPKILNWIGRTVEDNEHDPSRTGTEKRNELVEQILMQLGDLKDEREPEVRTAIEVALVHLRSDGGLDGAELRGHMMTGADLCIHHGAGTAGRAIRAWLREE